VGSPKAPQRTTYASSPKLEVKLGRQLYVATPVLVRQDVADVITYHATNVRAAVVNEHVRVIEHVEKFTAKLETHPLREVNRFVDSGIHIPESRTVERVPLAHIGGERTKVIVGTVCTRWNRIDDSSTGVPKRTQINVSEGIRIPSARWFAVFGDWTCRYDARASRTHERAVIDRKWISRPDGDYAVETPATEDLSFNRAAGLIEERRLVVEARDKSLSIVIVRMTVIHARLKCIREAEEKRWPVGERRTQIILRA